LHKIIYWIHWLLIVFFLFIQPVLNLYKLNNYTHKFKHILFIKTLNSSFILYDTYWNSYCKKVLFIKYNSFSLFCVRGRIEFLLFYLHPSRNEKRYYLTNTSASIYSVCVCLLTCMSVTIVKRFFALKHINNMKTLYFIKFVLLFVYTVSRLLKQARRAA
jgi:hypothetical protein